MKTLMKNTETYFATTELEAQALVTAAKSSNGHNIKRTQIDKRTKKEEEYYVVTIEVKYYDVRDLLVVE